MEKIYDLKITKLTRKIKFNIYLKNLKKYKKY